MSNLHRIKWIDGKIRNQSYPNCKLISEKFEISNRQALRDIEYLRDSLNAPIGYSQKYRGYFYTEETYSIPFDMVTEKESIIISKVIQDYKGKDRDQIQHLSSLFSNLNVNNSRYKKLASVINQGIEEGLKLKVEYLNKKNILCRDLIKPHSLNLRKREHLFNGFSEPGSYYLSIDLNDIKTVELTSQNFNKYSPSLLNETRKILPYKSRVEFPGSFDPVDYDYKAIAHGNIVEFDFVSSEHLLSYILMKSSDFKIISPNWLKKKLIKKIEKILKNNNP